ncbi:hypothetical protein ACFYS7_41030, partial [Streptomyces avermitilis]|uniref:hypothetical protein n=1 Tax=Streptomyces avermitilis TaxID=33903 RepID=UPI0036A505C5
IGSRRVRNPSQIDLHHHSSTERSHRNNGETSQKHPEHPKPVTTLYRIARCRLNDYLRPHGRVETLEAEELAEAAADGAHHDELADLSGVSTSPPLCKN